MARTSRRKERASNEKIISHPDRIYKVAAYARLSSDQDEKKNESIDVQIDIIKKYVEEQNLLGKEQMILYDVYCDNGKTGTNFNRDEFLRMMRDIRVGDVNCVIVKDFSRFGRNYLEAGNYIEKIFPFLGVRFIAVTDQFDTIKDGNDSKNMAMNIKNLVNDMYAKDFSKKAKIHLKQRRERGSYVGGATPYGFSFEWVGKNKKLVIDKNTAPVVSMIFDTFIKEKKCGVVTNKLNGMRINPPRIYKVTGEVYCREDIPYKGWDNSSIKRVLKNIVYTGTLAQGKEKQVVFEDAHEAIISKKKFEEAQRIIRNIHESEKKKRNNSNLIPLEENVYDDVLFCGSCGRKMTRHSYVQEYQEGDTARIESYDCLSTYSSKSEIKCESNRISKQMLTSIILTSLRTEFALYLKKLKVFIKHNESKAEEYRKKYQMEVTKIDKKIDDMEEIESILYMKYRSGELSQDKYVNTKLAHMNQYVLLEDTKKEREESLQNLNKFVDKQGRAIKSLMKIKDGVYPLGKEITREFVNSLIEKVYVYPGKRVEIIYAFTNEMIEGVR